MTFHDMVLRASQGVLNYAADVWHGKDVSVPEEQELTSNDSEVRLDVSSHHMELNSAREGATSSLW